MVQRNKIARRRRGSSREAVVLSFGVFCGKEVWKKEGGREKIILSGALVKKQIEIVGKEGCSDCFSLSR